MSGNAIEPVPTTAIESRNPGWVADIERVIGEQMQRRSRSWMPNEKQDAVDMINEQENLGRRLLMRESLIKMWASGVPHD